MPRRLIINADDFGMTSGVNRAITDAHRAGLVTSATTMANATATNEAISLATQNHSLATGCHLVLVDGQPLSEPDSVQSLIASRNGNHAQFRSGVAKLAIAAASGTLRTNEIHSEAAAQIQRLQSAGLNLSHIDCHMHSHIVPVVARAVMQAAREHGIPAVRNPFEPAWAVSATHKTSSLRSWNRSTQVTMLRALQPKFLAAASQYGLKTPDGTIGIAATGLLDQALLRRLVSAMPEGIWELVTHPGYLDQELAQAKTELKASRSVELQLLTSADTLQLFRQRDIQLISFREL